MNREASDTNAHHGHFYFDPNDPIYQDHFPGHPVVPGSLIVHAFIEALYASGGGPRPRSITHFRFKRFLPPGRYGFSIKPKSDGRMACSLYDKEKAVVTGVL
jgi:3-hydroxyacyl-[acyl-carrier-protein] dehydratase